MMNEGDNQDRVEDVDVAPPHDPEQTEDTAGEHHGFSVAVTEAQLPMVAMFLAATVLLIAVTTAEMISDGMWGYGIALCSVAMFFSLAGVFIAMREDLLSVWGSYLSMFLAVWAFAGALALTFWGPFEFTGNGYFAAWAMAVAGLMAIGVSTEAMKESAKGMGSMLGLLVSSIIVLIALSDSSKIQGDYRNQSIYGLVLACITICVVGFFLYSERRLGLSPSLVKFPVMACFAIMWIVAASFLTFVGPFELTGNGYFGAWGAAVTSVLVAMAARTGN